MIDWIRSLKKKPFLVCIFGWLLFPAMYLLVGIFTAFGISVETAFILASPAGVIGFLLWFLSIMFGINAIREHVNIASSSVAIIASVVPLVFLFYSFWLSANGYV